AFIVSDPFPTARSQRGESRRSGHLKSQPVKVPSRCADYRSGVSVMASPLRLKKHAVIGAAVALWVPTVAYGVNVLWKYSTTPGNPGTPPLDWPANSSIERGKGSATLVMFLHPQCPCSKAGLGELSMIMAR